MPWKASSVVEARTRFVLEHERGLCTMTELCRIYGIARETGYYWLRRYGEGGLEGLRDRARAPHRHPNQTTEEVEQAVLELRRGHMSWGARKLKRVLEREHARREWHHRRDVAPRRPDRGGQEAASGAAVHPAVRGSGRAQPAVVR